MSSFDNIKIRMYRHGFGDCFLVRFYKKEKVIFKMLIDCGLKHNDSVEGVSIDEVVKNISEEVAITSGNKKVPHLDVLVITHEHWDHVSGFKPEKKLFDQFDIDRIWMSWTENPKDKVAQQINAHLKENIAALSIATERLSHNTTSKRKAGIFEGIAGEKHLSIREDFDAALAGLLDFYGPPGITTTTDTGIKINDNFAISIETQKAFDHVKTKLAKAKSALTYFDPGTMVSEELLIPGMRIYVLGPPKNEKLNKDAPSKGAAKEVYVSLANAGITGFVKALLKGAGADLGFDDGSPFTNIKTTGFAEAQQDYYLKRYFQKDEAWRTINDDWLDMAGSLALQMDSDTNNSSLVLAIEIISTGKVLLFPGDAQVGNWLSWHDHTFNVNGGSKTQTVTATDLLNKTIFYKAGHHASHNATLKELGLELMTDENLVVFIPEKQKQYNGIPYTKLVNSLYEKAKGRVLFSADSNFPPEETLAHKPPGVTKEEWDNFKKNIELKDLFIEYTIDLPNALGLELKGT